MVTVNVGEKTRFYTSDDMQAELAMLLMDEDDDKEHFSLKAIMEAEQGKKKRKKRSQRHMMKLAQQQAKKNVQDSFKVCFLILAVCILLSVGLQESIVSAKHIT